MAGRRENEPKWQSSVRRARALSVCHSRHTRTQNDDEIGQTHCAQQLHLQHPHARQLQTGLHPEIQRTVGAALLVAGPFFADLCCVLCSVVGVVCSVRNADSPLDIVVAPLVRTANRYVVQKNVAPDEQRKRSVTAILNKLTPEKLDILVERMVELKVETRTSYLARSLFVLLPTFICRLCCCWLM
jgi:hypothetical protein